MQLTESRISIFNRDTRYGPSHGNKKLANTTLDSTCHSRMRVSTGWCSQRANRSPNVHISWTVGLDWSGHCQLIRIERTWLHSFVGAARRDQSDNSSLWRDIFCRKIGASLFGSRLRMTTARIPVKYVNGHWESFYGGAVLVEEGAVGELRVSTSSLANNAFRDSISKRRRVKILEAGTTLFIAIKPAHDLPEPLSKFLLSSHAFRRDDSARISSDSQFVKVKLSDPTKAQQRRTFRTGGLWLLIDGLEASGIESSTISLPLVEGLNPVANSLNHAYTLLSEVFETWRDSHTGNIYDHVFYQDSDEIWYPLRDLRDRQLAQTERQVIRSLWDAVKSQMQSDIF